jgi:hypothetical protein
MLLFSLRLLGFGVLLPLRWRVYEKIGLDSIRVRFGGWELFPLDAELQCLQLVDLVLLVLLFPFADVAIVIFWLFVVSLPVDDACDLSSLRMLGGLLRSIILAVDHVAMVLLNIRILLRVDTVPLVKLMILRSHTLTVVGKHLLSNGMRRVNQKVVNIWIQLLVLSLYHSLFLVVLDKVLFNGLFLRDMFQWIMMVSWRFWWVIIFLLSDVKVVCRWLNFISALMVIITEDMPIILTILSAASSNTLGKLILIRLCLKDAGIESLGIGSSTVNTSIIINRFIMNCRRSISDHINSTRRSRLTEDMPGLPTLHGVKAAWVATYVTRALQVFAIVRVVRLVIPTSAIVLSEHL